MPARSSRRRSAPLLSLLAASLWLAGLPIAAGRAEDVTETKAEAPASAKSCLSESEIREEVAAKRVIAQVAALRAARAAGGGEVVRARLCRGEKGLVYAITSLKRDGKVLRIEVDAVTGRLVERN
jgi:uncharacterized membrane protein YkoI